MILIFLNYKLMLNSKAIVSDYKDSIQESMCATVVNEDKASKSTILPLPQTEPLDYSIQKSKKRKLNQTVDEEIKNKRKKLNKPTSDIKDIKLLNENILKHYKTNYTNQIFLLKSILKKNHFIASELFLKRVVNIIYRAIGKGKGFHVLQFYAKEFTVLFNFLNFDIYTVVSTDLKSLQEDSSDEKIYQVFEDYLKKFNQIFGNLVTKDFGYINKYTNVKLFKQGAQFKRKGSAYGLHFLNSNFTNLLVAINPGLIEENALVDKLKVKAIIQREIHSIFTILIIKLYVDVEKLYYLVNNSTHIDFYTEDILRYRIIYFLLPMNDPILMHYSFESFILCFFSFLEYITHTTLSEENMRTLITEFLYPRFQVFSKEIKEKAIKRHNKLYTSKYLNSGNSFTDFKDFLNAVNSEVELTPDFVNSIIQNYKSYESIIKENDLYKKNVGEIYEYLYGKIK